MSNQSWRPNWADLNHGIYPDHDDDLTAWAWEFLRRNFHYQADYYAWDNLPDFDIDGDKLPKHGESFGDWLPMEFCETRPEFPAQQGETIGEYEQRTGQWPPTLHDRILEKWGCFPHDPASDCNPIWCDRYPPPYALSKVDPVFLRELKEGSYLSSRSLYEAYCAADDEQYVEAIGFDLRYNIDEQWQSAREELLKLQRGKYGLECTSAVKREKRPDVRREEGYEIMLRILDAINAGADDDQIINKLYASNNAVDDDVDAATTWLKRIKNNSKYWSESGYRRLVLFDQIPRTDNDKRRRSRRRTCS